MEPTAEDLAEITQRIFFDRKSTLLAVSRGFQAAELANTSLKLREQMLLCFRELPASAFEQVSCRQPGEEGWTAGEIISHNSDRLNWALSEAASAAGIVSNTLLQPPEIVAKNAAREPRLLGRALALEVLQAATDHWKDVRPILLTADHGQTKTGTHHGSMSVTSWFLLICIHDDDHLRQLRARQNRNASGQD